jgi:3-keto-disaccharide hydrolase/GMC oxidoreductase
VNLVATAADNALWDAMDKASLNLAQVLAGGAANVEYFYDNSWHAAAPPPFAKIRDGLGTTHHEAGTLWLSADPSTSVTDLDGRFHHIQNCYAAGPAVFPALGSANPSLTAFTLARRTAKAVVDAALPQVQAGTVGLITPALDGWQMAGSGRFVVVGNGTIQSEGGIGLLWYTKEQFSDFVLTLKWRSNKIFDNSGVFIRFPKLGNTDPANDWRLAVDQGYEIQIDDRGFDPNRNNTGSPLHMAGAVYQFAPATMLASKPLGQWNTYVIEAFGDEIKVTLNGKLVSHLVGNHGRPLQGFIGLQNHHPGSQVQFRNFTVRRRVVAARAA